MINIPADVRDIAYGGYHHDAAYRGRSPLWKRQTVPLEMAVAALLSMLAAAAGNAASTLPLRGGGDVAIDECGDAAVTPTLAVGADRCLSLRGRGALEMQLPQLLAADCHLSLRADAKAVQGGTAPLTITRETMGGHAAAIAIRPVWCKARNGLLRVEAAPVSYPGALFGAYREMVTETADIVSTAGCGAEKSSPLFLLRAPAAASQGAAGRYAVGLLAMDAPAAAGGGAAAVYEGMLLRLLADSRAGQGAPMRKAGALLCLESEAHAPQSAAGSAGLCALALSADGVSSPAAAGAARGTLWRGFGASSAAVSVPQKANRGLNVDGNAVSAAAQSAAVGARRVDRFEAEAPLWWADARAAEAHRRAYVIPDAGLLLTDTLTVKTAARERIDGVLTVETVNTAAQTYAGGTLGHEAAAEATGAGAVKAAHGMLRGCGEMDTVTATWMGPVQTGGTLYIAQSYNAAQNGEILEVS